MIVRQHPKTKNNINKKQTPQPLHHLTLPFETQTNPWKDSKALRPRTPIIDTVAAKGGSYRAT